MNKIKTIFLLLFIILSAGIVHAIFVLKNIPEAFDWDIEEEIDEEY